MGKIGDEFAVFGDRLKVDQISEINPCDTGDKIWEEYAGVADISADYADSEAEYFNLQGIRVDNPAHGLIQALGTNKVMIP